MGVTVSLEAQASGAQGMEIIKSQLPSMVRLLVTQWLMVWSIPATVIPAFEPDAR